MSEDRHPEASPAGAARAATRGVVVARDQAGVALIMVLAAIALMFVMAEQTRDEVEVYSLSAAVARDQLIAEAQARSAVNLARVVLNAEPVIRRIIAPILTPLMAMMGRGIGRAAADPGVGAGRPHHRAVSLAGGRLGAGRPRAGELRHGQEPRRPHGALAGGHHRRGLAHQRQRRGALVGGADPPGAAALGPRGEPGAQRVLRAARRRRAVHRPPDAALQRHRLHRLRRDGLRRAEPALASTATAASSAPGGQLLPAAAAAWPAPQRAARQHRGAADAPGFRRRRPLARRGRPRPGQPPAAHASRCGARGRST